MEEKIDKLISDKYIYHIAGLWQNLEHRWEIELRWANESKLISDVELWITFYKARNNSSHLYDAIIVEEVFTASASFLAVARVQLLRLVK